MADMEKAVAIAKQHRTETEDALKALLAIPSISTDRAHAADIQRAADWLANRLRALGMTRVDIMPTAGHPIVYAEWLGAENKPTALVYGHYDVQPADPLEEWQSPPFEPTVRGDNLYARGASDMKGAIVGFFTALESIRSADGSYPVNIKFLLEGEEEIGSPHVPSFLADHAKLFACDIVINVDGDIQGPDTPSICYALRGLAYFEIEVRGPGQDLHSGSFGGSVRNPIAALCQLLAGMHDEQGRITLPGFYDRVRTLTTEEREALAKVPHSDDTWKTITGAPALWGEAGYTTLERVGARPSLDVNGIWGGFTGEGSKTVLPAKATAKVSMRLVADQDPAEVRDQLTAYLEKNAPDTIKWTLREHVHAPGAITRRDTDYMAAVIKAMTDTFGKAPVFTREGGSVPIVGLMQELLGVETLMLGTRLPDSGMHGPNEKQHLPTLHAVTEVFIRLLYELEGIQQH